MRCLIMKQYTCCICGYIHKGENPPEKCPQCYVPSHCFESFEGEHILKQISTDEAFVNAMISLKEKDPIEYQLKIQQFKTQLQQQEQPKSEPTQSSTQPKCPHCSSTKIAKITGTERAGSILMWGIFSKKINKSFKCNNCGYTW